MLHSIAVGVVQEVGWECGACGCCACRYVKHSGHGHRTLVAWTTEARDGLFVTARNWRRARLLQADDVASEAEAEIAWIVAGYLLCGHIDFASIATSARSEDFLLVVFIFGIGWILWLVAV